METTALTLGTLMTELYAEYLELYGDEDMAALATAATINEIIALDEDEALAA